MLPRTKAETLQTPIFIVGPLRSGTTLLRLLLTHHPDIYIFGEFEGSVSEAVGNHWPEIHKYHDFVKRDRMMQALNFSVDESLTYEQLIYSFLEQAYERNPQPFIGASVHSRLDLLPHLWSDAKFIHLLRDPRDVTRSCIGMGWVGNVYEGAKYWIEPELRWDTVRTQVKAENCLIVRYEELVSDPVACLTDICSFLGLSYHPAMLEIEADTTYSRPDPKYAQQWKNKLTENEVAWVEYQCASLMKARGYELSGLPLRKPDLGDRFKLKLQSRWFRMRFNIQRWGAVNWFLFVTSKRIGPKRLRDVMQDRVNKITTKYLK